MKIFGDENWKNRFSIQTIIKKKNMQPNTKRGTDAIKSIRKYSQARVRNIL